MKNFYLLLANNLFASVTNFTVWFALVFYAYLQTRSVFATSLISGIYLVTVASTGFWFGELVDHHKKKQMMILSSLVSFVFYIICFFIYITAGPQDFSYLTSIRLWIFVPLLLLGVIAGNIRNIAIPTLVTLLVKEDQRDKANGLVGTTSGISFLITSVISGFLVGHSGMYWVLLLAIAITALTIIHLWTLPVIESTVVHAEHTDPTSRKKLDIKGTLRAIMDVPGLLPLILFTTFNNFLGGVFMSLMDAYGLSLVSVQVWGLLWGGLSTAFILGGLFIAKFGLGKNPVRTLFATNIFIWTICCVFTIYPSIIPLVIGMFMYLCVVPFIEASEHTIIQKVVPVNRQGRVFGFAQSVEQAASPITAFTIGPITQFIFIPFMTTGAGVELLGPWFGTGSSRGIALVFTLTGIIGLTMTLLATQSKAYKRLTAAYMK